MIKPRLKKWFEDQGQRRPDAISRKETVYIYDDFKPDTGPRAPVYIQLHGIGVALYDDGTFIIEDTTGG
jgi:hypothetical protein